jgi:D-3-phosphoglycerate dehydrogenase
MLGKRFRVVITTQIHEEGIRLLKREAEIVFANKPLNLLTSKDFIEVGKDADAIILVTNVEKFTREVIENLPKLRVIARHGVGYDNVDVKAASERGIYVTTTPVLDETVADQAFALLLCLARNICKGHNYVMSYEWKVRDPYKFIGTDVWGKTVGIIGLGRIGSRIAERAQGFKMRLLYYDILKKTELESQLGIEYRPLNELLKESDFFFIASPLTDKTRGIISYDEFALMKHSALIINIARGPIINHDALIKVLSEKRIAGAGLDVYDTEPAPQDDPLLSLDNVILTPHLASNTIECRKRMAVVAVEEVLRVLHGEKPKYAVNPEINLVPNPKN